MTALPDKSRLMPRIMRDLTGLAVLATDWVDDDVNLAIRDDGVGFDPENVLGGAVRGDSFGLMGIRERVELLDAGPDIRSQPGQGTTIRACFPVAYSPSAQHPTEGSD
jgi:nitrate/nitrite-specific signal transduction histidine kinase